MARVLNSQADYLAELLKKEVFSDADKEKILNMYDEGYAKGIDISGKVAEFFAK